MIAALERAGWSLAQAPEGADVLIVNTCGFISDAKLQSIETSLALKAAHPDKKVIMTGCLTERYAKEMGRELAEIDGFLGNRDPAAIVQLLEGATGARSTAPSTTGSTAPHATVLRGLSGESSYERSHLLSFPGSAYLKVAEGCSNRCTYCAIPLIRGDLASRDAGQIVDEAKGLLRRGIRELVLIAQDLGSYGKDLGSEGLVHLLSAIAALDGRFWVRLLYIHPDHFPDGLLDIMAADARILPYFDLPFQHASPGILRAMGRRGDPGRNLALLADIRARLPQAAIRSTFLVGFPGETDEDFERLLDFQEKAALDWLGTFTYSREEDTVAYDMSGRVTKTTAQRRKAEVEQRQIPITARALDARVGKTFEVLVEERVQGEDLCLGRSYLQAPDVDGLVVVRHPCAPGTVTPVRIIRRNGVDLEGEVLHGGA
jgi:ribosomal protein S12 methylthiotransferase